MAGPPSKRPLSNFSRRVFFFTSLTQHYFNCPLSAFLVHHYTQLSTSVSSSASMPTCAPIGSMSTRALVLSTFVALIEAKAIVTNNCPHDVYVWSFPAAGSLHTENLLVKSGAKYEEVWRYGTATNPGVAIKITSESNGIYKDTPEIDFAYSIDAHDASKIWIDLSPVRGSPVHHLSFHTCHGASETAERPTEQCHAADDINLTLCNPGQSTSAKHTMPIHESHPTIATTSAHQSTTHLSTYRSSTVECSIPQSMTSKQQSVPEPTRSKPHHSSPHFQPNRTSAFSQSRKPMTKTVSVVYAAPKTITQEHYSMPRSTTIKSQYAPPQSKPSQTLVYSSYKPANRSSSFEYIRPKPTTAYHNEYSEPEPTTLESHAPLSLPRPNITAHPSWSTRAAYPYVKVDSTVRKHITSPVYLLLD